VTSILITATMCSKNDLGSHFWNISTMTLFPLLQQVFHRIRKKRRIVFIFFYKNCTKLNLHLFLFFSQKPVNLPLELCCSFLFTGALLVFVLGTCCTTAGCSG
jgi:hypothetical protein